MQTVAEQITGRHWHQQSLSFSTVVFFCHVGKDRYISLHVCGWEGPRERGRRQAQQVEHHLRVVHQQKVR